MVSQLNEESSNEVEGTDMATRNPMEELAALEARMAMKDSSRDAQIEQLREEIKEFRGQIKELMELLNTLKGMFKIIKLLEGMFIFTAKMGAAAGVLYAMWRFGVGEVLKDIQKASGGK